MKVLYFLESFGLGGIESFVMNVLERAKQSDNDISCCVGRMTTHAFDGRIENLRVHFDCLHNDFSGFPGIRYLRSARLLREYLSNRNFDLVHIHANHGADYLWANVVKEAGVPAVVMHSHNTGVTKGVYKIAGHALLRSLYSKYVDLYLACSPEAAKWLCPRSVYGQGRYRVIPNGIVLDAFAFSEERRRRARASLGIDGRFVCGHVGRFNYQKNHEFLISLFARLHAEYPDTVLVLVGEGELLEEMRSLSSRAGVSDSVLFLGPRNDVKDLLSGFDCMLFPSRFEGLSVVLVEAQAAGLPIIASSNISPDTVLSDRIVTCQLEEDAWIEAFTNLRDNYSRGGQLDDRLVDFDISKSIVEMDEAYKQIW